MPMYTISILVAGKWRTVHGGLGRISKDFELHFGIRWTFLVTIPLQPPPPPPLIAKTRLKNDSGSDLWGSL